MITHFLRLLHQDVRLHVRNGIEWASLVLFFVIIIILLPFTLGPEPELLKRLAPGLIWLAVLLMSLLSLDKLFIQDMRDGTLDIMLLSPLPLTLVVLSKLAAQSIIILVSLLVMLFPAAILLGVDMSLMPVLVLTLLLGIPVLVLLGGVMSAISIALRRNAALLMILLVRFYIPVLIFAVGACDAQALGASVHANICLLAALLAFALPSAPFIIAATLRQGL
jgi:heme exporter protein B